MDNQHQQIPVEGHQRPEGMQGDKGTADRYVFTWRTTGITTGAKTLDDMIAALEGAADALRVLTEVGVVLDVGATAGEDACLVTTDPAVAERFGFTRTAANRGTK